MADQILTIRRNDRCWCGSRKKYKSCHGAVGPRHPPGTPLPEDPPGKLWLAPDVLVDIDALETSIPGGTPLVLPEEQPRARAESIDRTTARLAAAEPFTTVSLVDLAHRRDELLSAYGLNEPDRLDARVAELRGRDLEDLQYGVLQLARSTLERLIELDRSTDPPAVVRSEAIPSAELVGRTLLWADHYLVPDKLADAMTLEQPQPEVLKQAISRWHAERPLALLGLVVPVFDRLVLALTGPMVTASTQKVLDERDVLDWVEQQIIVHGPSAREVIFLETQDDIERQPYMCFYGRLVPDGTRDLAEREGTFSMRMLGSYDPAFDYGPWIRQERQNISRRLIQDVVREAKLSETLGGTYVTNSLFRARLLDQISMSRPIGATMWADVPALPSADAELLAKIAGQEESVAALRRTVGRTLRSVEAASGREQVDKVRNLIDELDDRTHEVEARIRSDRTWDRLQAALAGGAIAVGGVLAGPGGAASASLAAAGVIGRAFKRESDMRHFDAYVFWLAERALKPQG